LIGLLKSLYKKNTKYLNMFPTKNNQIISETAIAVVRDNASMTGKSKKLQAK